MRGLLAKHMMAFDARAQKERFLLAVMVIAIIYGVWNYLLWSPVNKQVVKDKQKLAVVDKEIKQLLTTLKLATKNVQELSRVYDRHIQEKNNKKPGKNFDSKQHYISPGKMLQVLKGFLVQEHGTKIIEFKKYPAKAIKIESQVGPKTSDPKAKLPQVKKIGLFKHAVKIKFAGDYFATLHYLRSIEKLKWPIFWDEVKYVVKKHPKAEVVLYIYTISNKKDWIYV